MRWCVEVFDVWTIQIDSAFVLFFNLRFQNRICLYRFLVNYKITSLMTWAIDTLRVNLIIPLRRKKKEKRLLGCRPKTIDGSIGLMIC